MKPAVALVLALAACDPAPVALPDIPGAVRTTSAAEACARPLPPRPSLAAWMYLKRAVAGRMGFHGRLGDYELDHLVAREMGGADEMSNLWLQPWPQARQKDRLENEMTHDFCANDRTDEGLKELQKWFATAQWRKEIKP